MKVEVDIDVYEIVIQELKEYYNLCKRYDKIDCSDEVIEPDTKILRAIEVVLGDFLTKEEYDAWYKEHGFHE